MSNVSGVWVGGGQEVVGFRTGRGLGVVRV